MKCNFEMIPIWVGYGDKSGLPTSDKKPSLKPYLTRAILAQGLCGHRVRGRTLNSMDKEDFYGFPKS